MATADDGVRSSPDGLLHHTGAVRFYERHGFVVVGGTEGDNEEGAPDLRMERRP